MLSLIVGGFILWFVAQNLDGLEWSMLKASGSEELEIKEEVHDIIANICNIKISITR